MYPAVAAAMSGAQAPVIAAAAASGFTFANAEAAAVVVAMTSPPDDARKQLIDDLVGALKNGATSGSDIWAKLDLLYILAAADRQAALLNWKGGGFDGTIAGTGTFTSDRGWQGDGSTGYIDTGFDPTMATAPNYALNSGHLGFWSRTPDAAASTVSRDIGSNGSGNGAVARDSNDNASCAINTIINLQNGPTFGPNSDGSGHFSFNRSASDAEQVYRNGVDIATVNRNKASRILVDANIFVGATGSPLALSSREFAAAHIGASLNAPETADLSNALQTYLHQVGAA
ncbi:MAG TPA: hypothetical protein VGF77_05670 [Allosphingosinicella sp.]|jgi:hypothetical protein